MPSLSFEIKVADETWIAAALLHCENPDRSDFTIEEIVDRAEREAMTPALRPGVRVHATSHAVANRPPSPGRYRMLFATGKNKRRLYRPGDPSHADRDGAKSTPETAELPTKYRYLLDWYVDEYAKGGSGRAGNHDPLLALRGSGKKLWADEHADDYVKRLREGWQ